METVEFDLKTNTRELQANTVLTRQVHTMAEKVQQDTSEIVAATKWISTTRKVALAVGIGVSTACGAILGAAKIAREFGWL